ncbi:MAG: TonB-dependent receptor [Paludibacter sp.]|nr:TonB-dependent receptor [Paludibacter sp.]
MFYCIYYFLKKQIVFATLVLLLFPAVLAAIEVDTTKVYSICEITVTEKYRNAEIRSSAPLQILSSKQIDKLNALQVSDAVKYFSGVTVKDYGGIGGLKTVSVRSLGASHTAVSYDGITLADCQTGQIDIGRFSLDNVDMLSLNNGQSDNIFQPARLFASGAVLNIRTLTPAFQSNKTLNGKATLKVGSFGLINPAFWLQQKINSKLTASLSAEWLSANGEYPYLLEYSYLGNGITSKETRKNTDVQHLRLEGALYANLSEKESGYVKTYLYDSKRGLPGATILYNTDNFSSQRLWDRTFFLQSHYEKTFSPLWSVQLNAKYNHGFLHYLDTTYLNDAARMESIYRQNEYYGSFSLLYRAFSNLSFSFSSDGFINNMTVDFETDALDNEFAVPTRYSFLSVLAAKYVSSSVLATASILSTIVNEKVEMGVPAAHQRRLSPYVSFTYKPFKIPDLRFRAFYKNIFRLPSFNDLYYSRIGNTNLRPEITDQFNVGVTYSVAPYKWLPLMSVTLDGYRNYVKDKIIAMPTKNIFVWSMLNLGKVEVTGLDLTAETTIALSSKLGLVLGGTYTYQRALDITTRGNGTYGHQIPYTPRVSGSGKASIETPWVDISYSLLWSGKRYGGFQNFAENRLPRYSDHGISAARDFKLKDKLLSVNLEILNLLNENYAIIKWFPMPGRSVRGTVAVRF